MAPTGARSEAAGGVTDAQGVEDDAAERLRLGRRRYRRYANERLLRALAGPMDADDFAALFLPPPFGNEPVPSAFSEAANALAAGRRADASLGGEEGAKDLSHALAMARPEPREQKRAATQAEARGFARVPRAARAPLRALARGGGAAFDGRDWLHWVVLEGCMRALAMGAPVRVDGPAPEPARPERGGGGSEGVEDDPRLMMRLVAGGDGRPALRVSAGGGYRRLAVHALAAYHGLRSATRNSEGAGSNEDAPEVIVTSRKAGESDADDPPPALLVRDMVSAAALLDCEDDSGAD